MTSDSAHTPHHRRRWPAVIVLLGIFGLAMLAVWWFSYDPEAQAPILATSTPLAEALTYVVESEESQLRATANGPAGSLESTYQMGIGTVELDEEGEGWRVIANLTFDARSLDTGNDGMNALLHRILEVEAYPTGSFVAQSDSLITDLNAQTRVNLIGQMELHGNVQEYVVPTTIMLDIEDSRRLMMTSKTVIGMEIFGEDIPNMVPGEGLDTYLQIVAYQGTAP